MTQPKNEDLHKKTLNLRRGDFEKMAEMFPEDGASSAIRRLISRFVDHNYDRKPEPTK